jgi:hypothetical protein
VAFQEIDESATNFDLHLAAGLTISGLVQNHGGAPVTNALVSAILTANWAAGNVGEAACDGHGLFSITALPPAGLYCLNVGASGYGFARGVEVPLGGMQSNKLQLLPIKLEPATEEVAGTLVGQDDKPVPGTWISFTGEPMDVAYTDANGHFAFKSIANGNWTLYVYGARINGWPPINGRIMGQGSNTNVIFKLPVARPAIVVPRQILPSPEDHVLLQLD